MKRLIDFNLKQWKNDSGRKPLLLRGARQVGKTYSIRELGKSFASIVEINFDLQPGAIKIFKDDLIPERIVRDISLFIGKQIVAGKTLLFLDEIQYAPKAIAALRYFNEIMPELHVIAAGSLLDFALDKVGLPVGRVSSLWMYPLSFVEFLAATGNVLLAKAICLERKPPGSAVHEKTIALLAQYLFAGGMPAAAASWVEYHDAERCSRIQEDILESYRQDFQHYAVKHQQKYVDLLFREIPGRLGKKFKYSAIPGEYRKRELAPALELLVKAGVAHTVFHSSGQGIPLGADVNADRFKVLFLDCGLAQRSLGIKPGTWLLDAQESLINKGEITEAFVGQEFLAVASPHRKAQLYYWHREARASNAEVDYLVQQENATIPVEVKSGNEGRIKSMRVFLDEHPRSPFGIRLSSGNNGEFERIRSFPLYFAASVAGIDKDAVAEMAI